MSINFQKSRDLMVENQLRPNKIRDLNILNLFRETPKEKFIPNNETAVPYSDLDINLCKDRGYLKNLHIAQLLNHAEIQKNHKILHLGALTGYVTFLLANLGLEVFAIEPDRILNIELRNNIINLNLKNVVVADGSLKNGYETASPFDRIFIDTPIKELDSSIIKQLTDNSGKIIMIKKENENLGQAIKITKNINGINSEYLFDVFSKFELLKESEGFKF